MLKHFVFVVIALCASFTGIIEWSGCFEKANQDEKGVEPQEGLKDEETKWLKAEPGPERTATEAGMRIIITAEDEGDNEVKDEEKREEEHNVQDTCSALGRCLCSLSLCIFAPFTSACCKFVRSENPYSLTFYLGKGFNFLWRGFQLRFLRAYGKFYTGLVSLLSAPVENEDARFFTLKSSLTAIWVPCVVGERPRTFLVTALVSRFVRTLVLVTTLLFYKLYFPEFLQRRTILLFCATQATWTSLDINSTSICPSLDQCFQFCVSDDCLNHRFRSCNDNDSFFFAILLSTLAIFSILSILSTFQLHQLSNYRRLYQVSRTAVPCCSPTEDKDNFSLRLCYPCCPFQPILHRSEIFNKIADQNFEEFEIMLKDAPFDALLRPNLQGRTPFHDAAELEDTRFLKQLLRKIPQRNQTGKTFGSFKEEEARCRAMTDGGCAGGERDGESEGEDCKMADKVSYMERSDKTKEEGERVEDNSEYEGEPERDEQNKEVSHLSFIKDSHGRSPIFNACKTHNLPALKLLLNAGFDPDDEDREGVRPMVVAMSKDSRNGYSRASGNTTVFVMYLLRNSKKVVKRTQVVHENRKRSEAVISQAGVKLSLSSFNIDWNVIDSIKSTKTLESDEGHKPHDPLLDSLLESLKKDAKRKDADGNILSVISKAVKEGNVEQLDLLLQGGISPNIRDNTGKTPYQRAALAKRGDLQVKLIEAGAEYSNITPDGKDALVEAVQDNNTKLAILMIKRGIDICLKKESNGMQSLLHIAAENENWDIFSHLLETVDPEKDARSYLYLDYDNHAASANCQSFLVHMAEVDMLHLLEKVFNKTNVGFSSIQHMIINHWDINCLLQLENEKLLSQIQEFASKNFARPPLENFTSGEAGRLVETLKREKIQFCGRTHDYEVRWNQSLPTQSELMRQYIDEKILYAWEEKSAYNKKGPLNGVQVATDGKQIKRIRFAFSGTFEAWRPMARNRGATNLGEGGVEQEVFLLGEGERITQVTTYTDAYDYLCGLDLSTTSDRHRLWGKISHCCKKSITKDTFLAYCSGQIQVWAGKVDPRLTFHWGQTYPTANS